MTSNVLKDLLKFMLVYVCVGVQPHTLWEDSKMCLLDPILETVDFQRNWTDFLLFWDLTWRVE